MKRFIPDSLAAWALLTLIVGLVVTQVSTLFFLAQGHENRQQMMEFFRLAERVSSVTRAVATAGEDQRDTLAADATRHYILDVEITALREEATRISARIADIIERDLQR